MVSISARPASRPLNFWVCLGVPAVAAIILVLLGLVILMLPLSLLGFIISLFAISSSVWGQLMDKLLRRDMVWDKTVRYRQPSVEQ